MTKREPSPSPPRSAKPLSNRTMLVLGLAGVCLLAGGIAGSRWYKSRRVQPTVGECDSREECSALCDRKDLHGCTRLATLYWFPKSGRRDLAKAEALYKEACDAGEPMGCFSLGRMYQDAAALRDKLPSAPDLLKRAAEGFDRRCNEGRAQACLDLASMYIAGRGVERSTEKAGALQSKAAPILERECTSGEARSCSSLSFLAWSGTGIPKDARRSYDLGERACELGDKRACTRVGSEFLMGRQELEKDLSRAARVFRRACDLGDMTGCHTLARLYHDGSGVALDLKEAAALQKKACDAEYPAACRELGRMFGEGEGVKKDPGQQTELYQREVSIRARRCSEESADDCEELSRNYRTGGFGVRIDPGRAREFEESEMRYRQENCDAGFLNDCTAMRLRLEGRPSQGDRMRAIRERECQLGVKEQCRFLSREKQSSDGSPPRTPSP